LKKTGLSEWGIYTSDNRCVYNLPGCETQASALTNANAWVSSWTNAELRTEDEQQVQQTDRVPSAT
jgi:hypothetical protein